MQNSFIWPFSLSRCVPTIESEAMKHRTPLFAITATFSLLLCIIPCRADIVHTVKKGETLYAISRTYHIPVDTLKQANGIQNPELIQPGMAVKIPNAYVVKKGDTLFGIAKEHHTTVDAIALLNDFSKDKKLKIGEVILLPTGENVSNVASGAFASSQKIDDTSSTGKTDVPRSTDPTKSVTSSEALLWPHPGKRSPLTGKLKGTQIEGKEGDVVRSVCPGKVVWVAPYRGYGKMVMVEAEDKSIFGYAGNGETLVEVGDRIEKGTVIGRVGSDDASGEGRVYFFVFKDGKPIELAQN